MGTDPLFGPVPGFLVATILLCLPFAAGGAGREPVLKQIQVPHNYYFREMYLPQLTSGPLSLSWSPDSRWLVYSMQGSLWRQRTDSTVAEQLTAGPGYDYQPDWSPDSRRIVFVRYVDDAMELQSLDLETGAIVPLTVGGAVNVEPRWSPDGTKIAWVSTAADGHFHAVIADFAGGAMEPRRLRPERKSGVPRYYYSPFDHELSPTWSPDAKELIFVANPDVHHGSGGLWRAPVDGSWEPKPVRIEESNWKLRPDWAADGRRVVYSSYLGRQWNQLWVTTADGGDPFPLSYGDYDVTAPRWSPDLKQIAYVSNESGNTAIWIQEAVGGARRPLEHAERRYLRPMAVLEIEVQDAGGEPLQARLAVTGSDSRSYAPDNAWVHADDGYDRKLAAFETHYFHTDGRAQLRVPVGPVHVTVWRGLEHRIAQRELTMKEGATESLKFTPEPLDLPPEWQEWQSADLHVHMNYGGAYRATPATLVSQARAEDLDVVQNLIVNKEQRIPDIAYFSPRPDPASTPEVLLLHAQEYHTSVWGHLGLLGLDDHLLLPDYGGYPNTAAASLFPTNAVVADLGREQHALTGYVHPFDVLPDPAKDAVLANALPVDAALGKVDYYEVVGFSDHRASAEVWHRLLNCGIRLVAGAGTDAMTNFASLRGPVGLGRVYVHTLKPAGDALARQAEWQRAFAAGRTMATNGPLLSFSVEGRGPGEELADAEGRQLRYRGWLRSIVPVRYLEVIQNGKVIRRIRTRAKGTRADFEGQLTAESGWVLLRAWSESSAPEIFDLYPYATTNPVFIDAGRAPASHCNAGYFLSWIDRIEEAATAHLDYNTPEERQRVLDDIARARAFFEARR